jgi:hypothetical protein
MWETTFMLLTKADRRADPPPWTRNQASPGKVSSKGFSVSALLFEFKDEITLVSIDLQYHDEKKVRTVQKEFEPKICATEILRFHMDYLDDWKPKK